MNRRNNLDHPLDKTLSGRERRRIELTAILDMKPRLALLDEPASGIDLLSIGEIAEVIQSLKREGTSVLLITHPQTAHKVVDGQQLLSLREIPGVAIHAQTVEGVVDAQARNYTDCMDIVRGNAWAGTEPIIDTTISCPHSYALF